jgi:undecaprenyl-diphosphatase
MNILKNIDLELFQFINGTLANPFFNWLMPIVTNQDIWVIPGILIWLGLIIFGKSKGRIAAVVLLIAVGLTDIFAAQIIKPLFMRLRPSHALTEGINLLVSKGGKYGFVSNHSANMFCGAVVIGYFYKKWKYYLYGLAALIAFSRVYVGVHYPGDVFIGGIYGYAIGWLILSLWIILKMRELKRGRPWVWYEGEKPELPL